MPEKHHQIIIIGGGAIGLSIAYHLTKLGIDDVLLLERHQLTSGTSWHAAGIVGPLRASMNLTRLAQYGIELFAQLETETGQSTGYQQTGGVWLAQKPERLSELKRIKAMGDRCGLNARMLTSEQIHARLPFLNCDDICGGLWVDEDGQINPVDLCMAYAKAARNAGITIRENTAVEQIKASDQGIEGVRLHDGSELSCDKLVLAAGAWSRQLAQEISVDLPLVSCEHMYIVTDVVESIHQPCPIIRDLDAGIYLKGDAGKLVLGTFENNPKQLLPDRADPAFMVFDEDWDHAEPMLEAGINRAPLIADAGISHFMNGPECFTPDTRQYMGESPQCQNLFIAAGFNSIGIMSSAGVGKVMATWVRDNHAPMDLWEVDIARMDPRQNQDEFLQARLSEAVFNQFDMHWPLKQYKTGRDLRRSSLHDFFERKGAVFGAPTGWERPLWFAVEEVEKNIQYSVDKQHWWPIAQREALHCQQHVSVFELSPFSKFEITGTDAVSWLQKICCSDIDINPGQVKYTLMLNPQAGIEAEITLSRFEINRFRIVSGAATRFKDLQWLNRHKSPELNVEVEDVTDQYAVIGLMGPKSPGLMNKLFSGEVNFNEFEFSCTTFLDLNGVEVLATSLSFVGETGWELTVATDQAESVLQAIDRVGREFNLGYAGHMALDSCRLEMGYLHWGHDIGSDDNPFEAGLGFTVDMNSPIDFMGKRKLESLQKCEPVKSLRLCEIEASEVLVLHDEPVYLNNVIVGHCTSGGAGFRTSKTLCFVLFYEKENTLAEQLQIDIAGERYPINVLSKPPYRKNLS